MSVTLRDAIHRANITIGDEEIWLPAWDFTLTRQRTAPATSEEMDVAQGDLEITDFLTILGISGSTRVTWSPEAAADMVFELLGDYDSDNVVDTGDYNVWLYYSLNPTAPGWEVADGNDDGTVDGDDHAVWAAQYDCTLELLGVSLV